MAAIMFWSTNGMDGPIHISYENLLYLIYGYHCYTLVSLVTNSKYAAIIITAFSISI